MPRSTSVTLGDHFEEFVRKMISAGRYQSVSEVVRSGLRKLEEDEYKLEILRNKLEAGEKSPVVKNFKANSFLTKMHKKVNA
jgi:antitoxin ParD1/3/4